jgi:hypothetical protein
LVVTDDNFMNLLGYYHNGKWIDGILAQEITATFMERKFFILVGLCSKTILNLL